MADGRTKRGGDDDAPGLNEGRGSTTIADAVVSKVAGIAAREVGGVHAIGGAVTRTLGRVGLGDERAQGISVDVGEEDARVELTVIVDYGESIPKVAQSIRENIVKRIEGIVGLKVEEVNITVDDLYFPADDEAA